MNAELHPHKITQDHLLSYDSARLPALERSSLPKTPISGPLASPLSGSAELAPRATVFLLSPLSHHRTADGKCSLSSASFSGNGRRFSWLWRPVEPCHNQPELFLCSLWLVLCKSSMRFFTGKYLLEMWPCTQHLLWSKHWASRVWRFSLAAFPRSL